MSTSHLSSVWALPATLESMDDEDERNPEEMSDEKLYDEFGIWSSKKGLHSETQGHFLRTALQSLPRDRRK